MDGLKFAGGKVAYTDGFLDWQLGDEHPVNPIRTLGFRRALGRFEQVGAVKVLEDWAKAGELQKAKWIAEAQALQPERVAKLQAELDPAVWNAQLLMFGATFELVNELIRDREFEGSHGIYFNPAGGELTGQHEGVEVLNDLAWACLRLQNAGYKVAYLDWDAHHSNETEQLLKDSGVLTISIHDLTTAATTYSDPEGGGFVNIPVGADDHDFVDAVGRAVDMVADFGPVDVLVLNAGADGMEQDESTGLNWTLDGMMVAGMIVGEYAASIDASVLAGGGGGELPLDGTPSAWSHSTGMVLIQMLKGALDRVKEEQDVDAQIEIAEAWGTQL